jgi:acetyltransferase-like isoleucine patch superfamily enzyme
MRIVSGVFRVVRRVSSRIHTWIYDRYLDHVYKRRGIEGINQVMLRTNRPKHVLVKFGASIGEGTIVYPHILVHAAKADYSHLVVGKRCRIMTDCLLDLTDRIVVEDTAIIGLRTSVVTHLNVGDSALKGSAYPTVSAPVRIGKGAVTCTHSVILQGVTVGEYAVVGAGTVVTKGVAPYSVVVGSTQKIIKSIRGNCG